MGGQKEMVITIIAALVMMAAYFLILYAGVGFIQDKRFFSSAPKETLAAIPDKKERFPGAHVAGWVIGSAAILMFAGAFVLGAWDGVKRDYGFLQFFWAVPCDALPDGDLRYLLLRLVPAVPFQFLPPFLPGTQGRCGAAAVWV